ncbi:SBBP repeat-containing protein [candidate division TA06 bacterium]|nr:SBBP repeat-containing protein [candidate division TA06 bacterium]
MRKALFVLCLVLLGAQGIWAQVTEEWVARYNDPGNLDEAATAIAVDNLGNVYVTGGALFGDFDTFSNYATIKYNSSGDTLWVRRYTGPGNADVANDLAVDSLGNVYITGNSWGGLGTGWDYATIKYDGTTGETLWVRRYDGSANSDDWASALAVDGSGNVYVTGYSVGSGTGYDYATIKYSSIGDTLWVRRYNGSVNSTDIAFALAVDNSGNVYVTGASESDYLTIKYSSNGDTLWVRKYSGAGNWTDEAHAIAVDNVGNVYVTGRSYDSGTGFDIVTIKYSSLGDSLWVRRYNGPGNWTDAANAITVDDSGNVYVTGGSHRSGNNGDYATIKYNSSGAELWVRRYNGPGNDTDEANALALDDLGNVYVTGTSRGIGAFDDYVTIKYSSVGDSLWVMRYTGPGSNVDWATAIALDDFGNVYVTGGILGGIGTGYDYATIKYSQTVGIEEENAQFKMNNAKLLQNLPNPFHHSTVIRYQIPSTNPESRITNHISLRIYDLTGRLVETLVDERQEPGVYQVQWEGKDQPTGIYFYRLQTGDFTTTKKLTLIK